jgi:hypothetical protein
MSALGRMGRFGNQVFQYAFLRLAAAASGARVECSPWAGRALFGHDDPPVTTKVPPAIEIDPDGPTIFEVIPELIPYVEDLTGAKALRVGATALQEGCEPGDIIGFFQFHTRHYRPVQDAFRALFQPRQHLMQWLSEPIDALRRRGRTIVAIHMRSGDYRWFPQFGFTLTAPPKWWLAWLERNLHRFDDPVLYVCSDDLRSVKENFRKYDPLTEAGLTVPPPADIAAAGAEFYRDYYVMTQADVLGIGNSTFSYTAAMLNERAHTFARPHWDFGNPIVEFDPWNAEPLLYQPGRRSRFFRSYPQMLQSAWATRGARGIASLVFAQQPAGMALIAGGRLGLAVQRRRVRLRRMLGR